MHLDVHTRDVPAEVARLEELGARRVDDEVREEHGGHWVVMTDPEGNELCVCDGGCCGDPRRLGWPPGPPPLDVMYVTGAPYGSKSYVAVPFTPPTFTATVSESTLPV